MLAELAVLAHDSGLTETPLGRFLEVLVPAMQARRVLQVGVEHGYLTVFLARALPPDMTLSVLEPRTWEELWAPFDATATTRIWAIEGLSNSIRWFFEIVRLLYMGGQFLLLSLMLNPCCVCFPLPFL